MSITAMKQTNLLERLRDLAEAIAINPSMAGKHGETADLAYIAIAEAEKQEPCPYCNDSGDVHSFDGEWRGRCTCPAGQPAPKQEPVGRIASNGYPELYKPHSLPAWTLLYLAAGAQPAPKQEPDTSLIVEIEFDDGEKKAIPVSGTAQNMRYLKAWLDRLWRERAAPVQAQEQRKPLTDELIEDLRSDANRGFNIDKDDYFKAFRDAEAAHNIKEQP